MTIEIRQPFNRYSEADGLPLEDGFIWVGRVGEDPETSPQTIYWDAELTVPAAQPVRTLGGFAARNGTASDIFINSNYSITVRDKNMKLIHSSKNVSADQLSPLVELTVEYIWTCSFPDLLPDGDRVIGVMVADRDIVLLPQSDRARAACLDAATADFVVQLKFETLTPIDFAFTAGGKVGVPTGTDPAVSVFAGDVVYLLAPAAVDATARNFAFSIPFRVV